jgi:photosynthetic reaction center cytochrome c subunit
MMPHAMRQAAALALIGALFTLAGCERPPMQSRQQGYRGTGMVGVENPRILAAQKAALPALPDAPPAVAGDGPKAKEIFQNVKVLGELPVAEFTRHMLAITQWVAPEQGCGYCHNLANLADDSKYTKVVARRMIQMTQHLNVDWKQHVAGTGVTCYTCHRGHAVPQQAWYAVPVPKHNVAGMLGNDGGQNKASASVGLASLPYDPLSTFLADQDPIRVQGTTALPTGNRESIKQAEFTYGLMMHISKSLGVNCTFCHNTRSFQSWEGPPQRVTAYYGIRMARDVNNAYLTPLTATFPRERLGPTGDVAKVGCATCHQGLNKPLGGLAMAKDFIGLTTLGAMPAAAALPPPLNEAMRSVLYFAVGSPLLEGEQAKGLGLLIATMTGKPETVATISGYHSAAGTLAQNQDLAKQRAFTVRDSLLAAGIAESRVKLDRPVQAEANIAGEDPVARRVEVTVK